MSKVIQSISIEVKKTMKFYNRLIFIGTFFFTGLNGNASLFAKQADNNVVQDESAAEQLLWKNIRRSPQTEALVYFDKLVCLNPKRNFGERGRFYADHGNFKDALSDFNEAVKLQPDPWLSYRGKLFSDNGRFEEALHDYSMLIAARLAAIEACTSNDWREKLKERLAEAYWHRAAVYAHEPNKDQALENFRLAAELSENFLPDYADFSENYGGKEVYLECLNKLVLKNPERYLDRRGLFYENHGLFSLAKDDYNRAVAISRQFGLKDGYSPRAWALKTRQGFYERQRDFDLASKDQSSALAFERKQKHRFGFSAYPKR